MVVLIAVSTLSHGPRSFVNSIETFLACVPKRVLTVLTVWTCFIVQWLMLQRLYYFSTVVVLRSDEDASAMRLPLGSRR